MTRPLEHVQAEILRVADEMGVHPARLKRDDLCRHSDVTSRDVAEYGGWSQLRMDAALGAGRGRDVDEVASRGVALRNHASRQALTRNSTDRYLAETLRTAIADALREHPIALTLGSRREKPATTHRLLTLLWSDLHFGAFVDPREVLGSEYNWQIAARRMAKLCVQAAEWKPQHRDETDLAVVLNGDIIEGVIHLDSANIRPLAEQIRGAVHILVAALDYLRHHYRRISVHCLPGNHDRAVHRGPGRATAQRWDGHADAIYLALETAFRHTDDVQIHVPRSGIAQYRTPGEHLVVAMHGDCEPSVANVGRALQVARIEQNLYRLNASGAFPSAIDVLLCGHWHSPCLALLPNGSHIVVNGCLIGGSSWSQNGAGIFNAEPAQIMFESVPGYPLGDSRIVRVRDADGDERYDAVIAPPRVG